ncbi:MAG: AAA family ATPase [Thermoleophilia bacterium]|nr:AAA family ATPase [Thermoleophilia bacterium]
MVCPRCTTDNEQGRKFCAECGAALALVCASCGAANSPGAKFCGECGSPLTVGAAAPPAPAVERRLVSILFADLVGFTSVAESRDAEDVRALLSRYFELARTVVERYGGQIEKFIGDAVMAVWGTPVAREDDAERAVRAALELVPSVAVLGAEAGAPGLAARAGVVTGEAAVTLGAEGQGMVAGDLVNAASRIQGLAEPGTVLVADGTRRATEVSIAYADAGMHELRGRAEPVRLARALRVTAGRGGSLKADTLEPPFVGRERELRLLKELFHASADERKAHLISIVGIAGIGKSRLARELQRYLDGLAQTVYWHRGRSLAYGEGVSDWALAEMVRMRAGIAEGEDAESAREKLRSAIQTYVGDPEERQWIEPRLAQLLALGGEVRERSDLAAGWRLFLERLAEHGPVVLVFEDLQWADAPLLEFVAYLLDWSRNHPLLVLGLTRPELEDRHPRWASGIRNATTLSLEPLPPPAMEALLDGFVGGLPADLRRQVLDRAEGVPLYAVETVRMLLDRGLLVREGDAYRPAAEIDSLGIPESLHALVAARLDALDPDERRFVHDASVVGKTFQRDAVRAATTVPEADVDRVLAALVRKEILTLQADPRSPERGQYGFLQDLLRQVAYETMPRGERKSRHLAVAASLERGSRDGDDELAEIVASHYVTALELDPDAPDADETRRKAYATLVKAGERAAALAASENAQRYFERALELARSPLERAELHEQAGAMAASRWRTADARHHFEQAVACLDELGLSRRAARVAARRAVEVTWQQEHDIERAVAEVERSFEELARDERDADFARLAADFSRLLFFSGRVDEALATNDVALEIAEALQLPDVLSHGLNTKGMMLAKRGRVEEGMLLVRHSLEVARRGDVSEAAIRAHINLAALTVERDRYREALEVSHAGAELARRVGQRSGETNLTVWESVLLFQLGEWDTAETALSDDASAWERGALVPLAAHRGAFAEARRLLVAAGEVVDMNETQGRANYRSVESVLLIVAGSPREALAAAEDALTTRGELGIADVSVKLALVTAMEAARALRDDAKLDELLATVEALPPGQLTPFLRAVGARFNAHRSAAGGDADTADAAFAAAAQIFGEIESPFEVAVVRLEHAEWLASEGRDEEAARLLDEAEEIFERLRAAPWLERTAAVRGRQRAPEVAS